MKYTLVGVQKVDYNNKQGNRVYGAKVFCTVDGQRDTQGRATSDVFISQASAEEFHPLIGKSVSFVYEPTNYGARCIGLIEAR